MAEAAPVVLSVEGLVVGRGERTIVAGASFDLCRGQILGLVGESGSGKTLTSLALAGVLPRELAITAGTIDVPGGDAARDIAIVFQDAMSCLNPAYTVGRQMRRILLRRGSVAKREVDARILQLLSEVGLPEPARVVRQYPHQLSGGMRQRVMIAIAIGVEPKVLIADEPTTALDVTVQAQILELLKSLRAARGLAVIMVTHDLGVVADVCDDVLVMRDGEIVERGSTERVFAEPAHAYTRELLESTRRLEQPPPGKADSTPVAVDVVRGRS